jgi:hypothetical protein
MKYLWLLLAYLSVCPFARGQTGETPIEADILKAVVKIKTAPDHLGNQFSGTGFIVSACVMSGKDSGGAYYLATNKHMIGNWNPADRDITEYYKYIDIFIRRGRDFPQDTTSPTRLVLTDDKGDPIQGRLLVHPDSMVDVAVIFINSITKSDTLLDYASFDVSYLIPFSQIVSSSTNIGSQVYVLGYPLGIIPLGSLSPLSKSGYVASVPGQQLSVNFPVQHRNNAVNDAKFTGKIILVDGLIVPGNSGGPVVMPSELKTRYNPATGKIEERTRPTQNAILGILSGNLGPSGLSVVWSADYVRELIDGHVRSRKWITRPCR